MIAEKIELLGKNLYTDIPGELTLSAIPTASELDYVGSEDFETTMLDKILPKAIEEDINFHKLLEFDFQWVCRCLRILNYGPMYTTNGLFCSHCGKVDGQVQVDLRTVNVKPIPEDLTVNDIVISKDEFIDFKEDIHIHIPTIQEMLNAYKDKLFQDGTGKVNREYARICYMIIQIGKDNSINAVSAKNTIEKKMTSADYIILKDAVAKYTDFGLRAGGTCICPSCKQPGAAYIALADDRFFRPTVGDLKAGRNDRDLGQYKNISRSAKATV